MNELRSNGIEFNGLHHCVKLRAIIADTPARCFLKGMAVIHMNIYRPRKLITIRFNNTTGIRSFNHHAGCQKCVVRGCFSNGVMFFESRTAELRTDGNFRSREDPAHHLKYSKIEELTEFDLVRGFPISDPLHLLHIGVMKRMMSRWLYGTKSFKKTISKNKIKELDDLLSAANVNKPTELNRPIRKTIDFARWKATEHRAMLLYVGITILKDLITAEEYEMFLNLCCAIKLASVDKYLNGRIELINHLLNDFIQMYTKIYGKHTLTSNVHNLCHISKDLERFGTIETVSTYPFENHLGQIKRTIRAYYSPLQQFARRVHELEQAQPIVALKLPKNVYKLKFPNGDSFQTISIDNKFQLSSRKIGDCWFLSADKIIKFKKAVQCGDKIAIYGKEIPDKHLFFEKPFDSAHINIYISNGIQKDTIVCTPDVIQCKLFRLPYKESYVFQPLLFSTV